jgi:hypothetical protein
MCPDQEQDLSILSDCRIMTLFLLDEDLTGSPLSIPPSTDRSFRKNKVMKLIPIHSVSTYKINKIDPLVRKLQRQVRSHDAGRSKITLKRQEDH